MCGGKLSPFLAKLATYDRCVVVANGTYNRCVVDYNRCLVVINGPIMRRNFHLWPNECQSLTIGV